MWAITWPAEYYTHKRRLDVMHKCWILQDTNRALCIHGLTAFQIRPNPKPAEFNGNLSKDFNGLWTRPIVWGAQASHYHHKTLPTGLKQLEPWSASWELNVLILQHHRPITTMHQYNLCSASYNPHLGWHSNALWAKTNTLVSTSFT